MVGVGNRLKADDGAGPLVIDRLRDTTPAVCLDAGTAPENVAEKIARLRPAVVLFADALDFGGRPGDWRLVAAEALAAEPALSTHAGGLALVCEYLRVRAGAELFVLGIQPGTLALGEPMSAAVRRAVEMLAERLREQLTTGANAGDGSGTPAGREPPA